MVNYSRFLSSIATDESVRTFLYQMRVGYPMRIFGLNIVETFHETSLQPRDITGVIVADLVLVPEALDSKPF